MLTCSRKTSRDQKRKNGVGESCQTPRCISLTTTLANSLGTELMHVRLGGTDWIFLNSSRVVEDLMEKRSALYSSRPITMVGEVISRDRRPVLQQYGDQWREVRKSMTNLLTGRSADRFRPMSDLESRQCLYELLQAPDHWYLHFIRLTASCECANRHRYSC